MDHVDKCMDENVAYDREDDYEGDPGKDGAPRWPLGTI